MKVAPENARIVRVRDTKYLELLYVSAPALSDLLATGAFDIVEQLHPIRFDAADMFVDDGMRAGPSA